MENWRSNRDKKREPRQGKFYCWNCDGCLVNKNTKCPRCGKKTSIRDRNKKD